MGLLVIRLASPACEGCEKASQSDLNNYFCNTFMSIHHTMHSPFLQRKDTGYITDTDNGYKGI